MRENHKSSSTPIKKSCARPVKVHKSLWFTSWFIHTSTVSCTVPLTSDCD